MQRGVHVLAGGAGARLQEALLEVVAQEGVEDRIHRAVAVAEEAGQQEAGDGDVALALFRWRIDQRHLGDPVGQPAEHVHGDHCEHQLGHLAMRALLLLGLVLRAYRTQFPDHQEIEGQYEDQRNGEAQDESVQGEGGLAAAVVRPIDIAAHHTVGRLHGVGV